MAQAPGAHVEERNLDALRDRCAVLKTLSLTGDAGLRLRHAEEILRRASEQRAAVQAKLFERVDGLLQELEEKAAVVDEAEIAVRKDRAVAPSISTLLSALTGALTPEAVVPDKAATGLAFDEYLRLQENEALLMWAHDADQEPASAETTAADTGAPAEMRAARQLRELRLKRYADSLVERALAEAPEDPGPLNPQMLSIKALSHMRDLSPQYLNRFVSYVDTMIWLEKSQEGLHSKNAKAKGRRRK